MGAIQKGMPFKCYHGKTRRVYNVTQHAVDIIVNKQVKDKILAKRISVQIEVIKHSKSRDSFLKRGRRTVRKRRPRRRSPNLVKESCQEKEAKEKEPELSESTTYEFMA
ncbi:60S ribosomal protein L21-like [Apodemus sylvaticus]|uniref:60S ribosomal protein L21-like n=1 Tax=Apodemus sylvaticus TaxID=10129 RepID=UPI002244CCB8|nr:60S ribosomal protein L21-like [Apodemus sylvaticus]